MLEHLHKQQQQQQQQQQQGCEQSSCHVQRVHYPFKQVLDLAEQQLALFDVLFSVWPTASSHRSCLSSSSELGAVELSALQLAPLVLDASGGKAAYVASVLRHAFVLCRCLRAEVEGLGQQTSTAGSTVAGGAGGSSSSSSPESLSPAVQQLLQSEQLLKLLAATQALYAQVLQRTRLVGDTKGSSSSSSSSSSTAAVTATGSAIAATAEVLQATGLSWTHADAALFVERSEASSPEHSGGGGRRFDLSRDCVARMEAALSDAAVVMRYVLNNQAAAHTDNISTSSSSSSDAVLNSSSHVTAASGPDQQQQQQQQEELRKREFLRQLLLPWAVVQVELLQLIDNVMCSKHAFALWATFVALEEIDAAAYAALKRSLLQPLLQLLTQCVQEAPASSSGASDSSSSCSNWQVSGVELYTCLTLFLLLQGLLGCLMSTRKSQSVTSLTQHTVAHCTTVIGFAPH
jgi:hypothetical protein